VHPKSTKERASEGLFRCVPRNWSLVIGRREEVSFVQRIAGSGVGCVFADEWRMGCWECTDHHHGPQQLLFSCGRHGGAESTRHRGGHPVWFITSRMEKGEDERWDIGKMRAMVAMNRVERHIHGKDSFICGGYRPVRKGGDVRRGGRGRGGEVNTPNGDEQP
jgi:hypothetical protein